MKIYQTAKQVVVENADVYFPVEKDGNQFVNRRGLFGRVQNEIACCAPLRNF